MRNCFEKKIKSFLEVGTIANIDDIGEVELQEEIDTIIALEQAETSEFEQLQEDFSLLPTNDEPPEKKKLKRELKAEALARLEQSARTTSDYTKVVDWWDTLDRNRERKERYHEVLRSGDDIPLEYGKKKDGLLFPNTLNSALTKQIRNGDFIDAIFNCPYEIHELATAEYLSQVLKTLNENHKELLYLYAIRLFSSKKIGEIRGQSDRNIRKVRVTILKKIHKAILPLILKLPKGELTTLEKNFIKEKLSFLDETKED